jgi:hypothetical protein
LVQAQREIIRRGLEAEAEATKQRLIEEKKAKKDLAKAYLKGLIEEKLLSLSERPVYHNEYVKEHEMAHDELGFVWGLFRICKYREIDSPVFCFNVYNNANRDTVYHYYSSGEINVFVNHVIGFRDNYAFDKYDSEFRLKTEVRSEGERAFDDIFTLCAGDCCVCYEPTKSKTKCCKQHYCLVCERKAGNKCPMCRRSAPFSDRHVEDEDDEDY